MKQLLYVGAFNPWTDKHDDELAEALETFDQVIIGVTKVSRFPIKGQPTKVLDVTMKDRIKIVYFNSVSKFLRARKELKYIMFER